uniref:DUF4939 domain-containing protein n=1 Tax=Naja naja TaxID=35670 RepID=A0A8C6XLI2_NAJNA
MPRVITFCSQPPLQLASVLHGVTMDQIRADNDQLTQQLALLTVQVAQMQAVQPRCKCPVVVPDKFDGSLAQFPAFFGQCQLYLFIRLDFPTDLDKVGFLISLLSGSAACWVMPLKPCSMLPQYLTFRWCWGWSGYWPMIRRSSGRLEQCSFLAGSVPLIACMPVQGV